MGLQAVSLSLAVVSLCIVIGTAIASSKETDKSKSNSEAIASCVFFILMMIFFAIAGSA